jgi:hypothetical protein
LTEVSGFFAFVGFLQSFDLGKQAVAAQAAIRLGWHWDFGQFRAPAAAFGLAVHRRSALRAFGLHVAMMAQMRRGV